MTNSIQKILISQKPPINMAPYTELTEKFGVSIEFKPFFKIMPLPSRDFRAQRINILDYTAVIFSSRHAIDAYFHLCEELRIKVPETMKYFCTTEAVAVYLQKHIVFRKRKIFFGDGTPDSIISQIGSKHKGENFLVTTSDTSSSIALTSLLEEQKIQFQTGVFVTSESVDLNDLDIKSYDLIVFFNPSDIKSLYHNFPEFQQEDTKFISYGKSIAKAMKEANLSVEVQAPTANIPSVAKAIESYLAQ